MKKKLALRLLIAVFLFQICGLLAFAQSVELGWTDFPYTATDGNLITGSYTGSATNWTGGPYSTCGVTTKNNSIWLGQSGAGSMTNTFSMSVTSVSYKITGSDSGEAVTFTTNAGTPTVTVSGGCGYIASSNVATCSGSSGGTTITVSSATPFTSIQVSHNGASGMQGSLVTLVYSGVGGGGGSSSVPVSPWAILVLFLVISFAGYKILRKTTMTPA
jgi:hypothetical protein